MNLALTGGTLSNSGGGIWFLDAVTVSGGANTSTISANNVMLYPSGGVNFNVSPGASNGIDLDVTGSFGNSGIGNSLIKSGNGVMVLSGANGYGGATTISAGTLVVNGSLNGAGIVAVNGGAALSGSGSVGNVTVISGGTLAPGYAAGAGTLNAATLTLQTGSVLNYMLGAAPGGNAFVNISQNLTLPASGVTLNILDSSLSTGTYALFQYGTGQSGLTSTTFSIGTEPASVVGDNFTFADISGVLNMVISGTNGLINGVWATNGPGTWSTSGNWTGGVPGSGQDTAVFGTALTSGTATVTLDGSRSLASLGFSTTGGASYTISPSTGSTTLTLANSVGSATLSNSGGNHTINAPIVLGSNLNVSATTGSALTIAGGISESGTGTSVSVSGGGELILSGTDTYTGGTNVSAATLAITSAIALSSTGLVTISGGGKLVLGSGAGIGALLTASAPISSGAVALSAAAAIPATLAPIGNSFENMATLGGAPSPSQGGGGSAVGVTAAAVPEPGTFALLAAGAMMLAGMALRKRR